MSLIAELQRRNVIRVGLAYLAGAWLLIEIAGTLFPMFGVDAAASRIVVIVLAIGFVPMLVFAWVFELTPEGLKREKDVERDTSIAVKTAKRLDRLIMVVLALALVYFAFDKFVLDPGRDQLRELEIAQEARQEGRTEAVVESYGDKSIAVLPFADMSPGSDQAYLSDGISEELMNLLAQVPELRVISRSSAFALSDDDLSIPEIAKKLSVAYVLEGSVRKAGNKIRITAQLIEAGSDTHLWSQAYDRALDDVFAIQDEIAATVVDELKIQLLDPPPKSRLTDPEVYSLYLQARYLAYNPREDGDKEKAQELLNRAMVIDPGYVPALLLKSWLYLFGASDSFNTVATQADRSRLFNDYNDRALAIEPDNPVANTYLAWRVAYVEDDLEKASRMFNKAVRSTPQDSEVLRIAGTFAKDTEHYEEAVLLTERAVERDPMCGQCWYNLSQAYLSAGRLDEAETAIRRRNLFARGGSLPLGWILQLKGNPEAALAAYDEQRESMTYQLGYRALALHDLGRQAEFDKTFDELIKEGSEEHREMIAWVYAWVGDNDAAFLWLDRWIEIQGDDLRIDFVKQIMRRPRFKNLYDDPRWTALRERFGQAPERLAALEIYVPPDRAAGAN